MWSSLTDQLVRKFKDSVGINITMKKFFIFVPVPIKKKLFERSEFLFRTRTAVQASCEKHSTGGVCPQRRPHAQQQLARDLEVERSVMGQRCRPQSFGEVQRCNTLLYVVVPL